LKKLNLGQIAEDALKNAKAAADPKRGITIFQRCSKTRKYRLRQYSDKAKKLQRVQVLPGISCQLSQISNSPILNLPLINFGATQESQNGFAIYQVPTFHPALKSKDAMRLIRILPAEFRADVGLDVGHQMRDGAIQCSRLSHYNALSYSWGPPPNTLPILLNRGLSKVGPKLLSFLMSARRENTLSHYYWIDALGINQEDMPKAKDWMCVVKGVQVPVVLQEVEEGQ
jgi:hypothetical protein